METIIGIFFNKCLLNLFFHIYFFTFLHFLDLPWNARTIEKHDLTLAEQILNRDHSGLFKVKKRILEYLAVTFLRGNSKGTIICLVGPPGVGKSSLGKSIADALNRKYERIALGGVHDES